MICIIVLKDVLSGSFQRAPPTSDILACRSRRVVGHKSIPEELQSTGWRPFVASCLTSTAVFLFQVNSERRRPSCTRLPKRNAKWRTVRRPMGWLAAQVKNFGKRSKGRHTHFRRYFLKYNKINSNNWPQIQQSFITDAEPRDNSYCSHEKKQET